MRNPKPGDYGVTEGGGWAMWLTRLGTFSRYGHAAIALEQTGDVTLVMEAYPGGARARTYQTNQFVWSNEPITDVQRQQIVTLATSASGVPYDWRSIALFILRFWGARLKGRSDDHADDKMICSELVAWAYREAGRDLFPGMAPGDVSPGDLAQRIMILDADRP